MLTLWHRRKKNDHAQPKLEPVPPWGANMGVEEGSSGWAMLESDPACIGATDDPLVCSGGSGMGFCKQR